MNFDAHHSWWDPKDILNRLRLRLFTERSPIRNKLHQSDFLQWLESALVDANRASSKEEACSLLETFLLEKSAPASPYIQGELTKHVLALVKQGRKLSSPPRRNTSSSLPRRQFKNLAHPSRTSSSPSHPVLPSLRQSSEHWPAPLAETQERPSLSQDRRFRENHSEDELPALRLRQTASAYYSHTDIEVKTKPGDWWNCCQITESVMMRLEKSPDPLRKLLLSERFMPALNYVLTAGNEKDSLREALAYVSKQLRVLEGHSPALNTNGELWKLLRPMLELRKNSESLNPLPIPLKRLREIAEEEQDWQKHKTSSYQELPRVNDNHEELWDWEHENQEMKGYISKAVHQIASPSSSYLELPAVLKKFTKD